MTQPLPLTYPMTCGQMIAYCQQFPPASTLHILSRLPKPASPAACDEVLSSP